MISTFQKHQRSFSFRHEALHIIYSSHVGRIEDCFEGGRKTEKKVKQIINLLSNTYFT